MRILLILSLLTLIASAVMAPLHYQARERAIDTSALGVKDARERAALAEKDQALGMTIRACEEILEGSPGDLDAIRGLFRATVRLNGLSPRQQDMAAMIQGVTGAYIEALPEVDPDGAILQDAVRTWVDDRIHDPWYIARATVSMWLCSRGEEAGLAETRSLMGLGPYAMNYYGYCQRVLPNWIGVEKNVRLDLESQYPAVRTYAAVTLMIYNRIYGVGAELLAENRAAIRDLVIRASAKLTPNSSDNAVGTPGGQTILALALLDDRDADRIIARLRPLDHPYLSRVLEIAKFWIGLEPWEKADFSSRRYDDWYPGDQEAYYLGLCMDYAGVVRRLRTETDPEAKAKLEERAKKLSALVGDATYVKMTTVKVLARRVLAAIFPEQSLAIHRELVDQGGVDSIYGAMALPLEERVPILLPALSASAPDNAALAVVGLLRMDGPVPIQMPVANK